MDQSTYNFEIKTVYCNMSLLIDIPKDFFTCITCRVAFKNADMQRSHYKTDWHRYNLKRKVAELPPISAEEFQQGVKKQRSVSETSKQYKNVYCLACHKSFSSQNAFDNHLHSRKHKDNEKNKNNYVCEDDSPKSFVNNIETESDIEEVDSDDWEDNSENPVDNHNCIFCMHHSRNFFKNLEHMTLVHSFFIPDIEYCTDLFGLLRYLADKVSEGFMCLWCNEKGKTFYNANSARQHMLDKGHCKMIHEGMALAEYADFYDYSTSYPDAGNDDIDIEEEIQVPEIDDADYQLVLPSGVIIGHRNLMRYYKQSVNRNKALVAVCNNKKLHKVLATYKSLGWTETQQAVAAKKARDIHYMKRMQSRYNMKMGMKNNNLLQKHFRRQMQF